MSKDTGLTVMHPTVQCTKDAWAKLQAFSRCTVKSGGTRRFVEISGYLIGEQVSPSEFLLTDALLVPSSGTMGSTEMDNKGTAKLLDKLMQSEDPKDHQILRSMIGWWHVHPGTGGTFWSQQDKDQMDKFGEGGYDWLISIVFSHSGPAYRSRIDFFRPYRIYVDNIPIEIEEEDYADLQAQVQAEVDEHVTIPKPKVWQGGHFPGRARGGGMTPNAPGGKFKVTDRRSGGQQQNWEKQVEAFRNKQAEKAKAKALPPAKEEGQTVQ